ncbi:MAG: PAAR domain-containing protein [Polyangiaceae bacterium]|nr:PAAR domain-containing protein [Polyangiaceae bacterium]
MHPAARVGDPHLCPAHGGGPVAPAGFPTVQIGGAPAARQGDVCTCPVGPDAILDGSPTVLIGNQAAARMTERCAHGGFVAFGFSKVLIGNPAVGPDGKAMTVPPECAWLYNFGDSGPGTATGGKLDRLRDTPVVKSTEVVQKAPPGESTPLEYTKRVVSIRGHEVTIYEPTTGVPPPQWLPTGNNMANALASLSDEQLAGMKEVYIVPHPYPPRNSDVANHSNGVVQYFPRAATHPQSDVDWVFHHESAHNIWDKEMAKNPDFEAEWRRAADKDHRSVSAYGDSGIGEDFADFMVLYANVIGTPCEASARGLFGNRMKIMDKIFPNGIPVRNPGGASNPF